MSENKIFKKFDIKKKVDLVIDNALTLSIQTTPQRNLDPAATIDISPLIFLEGVISSVNNGIELAEEKINEISAQNLNIEETNFLKASSTLAFSPLSPHSYSPIEFNSLVDLAQSLAISTQDYRLLALPDLYVAKSNLETIKYTINNQWSSYARKTTSPFELITKHYLSTFQNYSLSLEGFIRILLVRPKISVDKELTYFYSNLKEYYGQEKVDIVRDLMETTSSLLNYSTRSINSSVEQLLHITVLPHYDANNRMMNLLGENSYAIYLNQNLSKSIRLLDHLEQNLFKRTGINVIKEKVENVMIDLLGRVEGDLIKRYGEIQQLNEARNFHIPMIYQAGDTNDILRDIKTTGGCFG